MPPTLRAVIFDFDGLIVDTESIGYLSWREIFEANGHTLSVETYSALVGTNFENAYDPRRDLEQRTGRSFDWPSLETQRRQREIDLGRSLQPLPGVLERLAEAHRLGLRTAIASSSTRDWIRMWMDRLQLASQFHHFSTVDDTGHVKPHPSLFLHAASQLGVDHAEAVILEDSLNGLKAAQAAGIRCIAAPSPMTQHLDFNGAWQRIPSLEALSLETLLQNWP